MLEGSMMITYNPDGKLVNFLRMVVTNRNSTTEDMDFVVEEIARLGKDLWTSGKGKTILKDRSPNSNLSQSKPVTCSAGVSTAASIFNPPIRKCGLKVNGVNIQGHRSTFGYADISRKQHKLNGQKTRNQCNLSVHM